MNNQIKQLIKDIKNAKIAKSLLNELIRKRDLEITKLRGVSDQIKELDKAINLKNNYSIQYIYKRLSGQPNKDLEIQKEFYLSLSLEYNELVKSIELIEYEIEVLKSKSDSIKIKKLKLKELILAAEDSVNKNLISEYKKVVRKLEKKISLSVELAEAISQGRILNKRFNKTLKFQLNLLDVINNHQNSKGIYKNYRIDKVDKYQSRIVEVQVELVKFKKEYNDVHQHFFGDIKYSDSLIQNFLNELRVNLITDIRGRSGLKNSIQIVNNFKSNIQSILRSLRSDLRKIDKEIVVLEQSELALFDAI